MQKYERFSLKRLFYIIFKKGENKKIIKGEKG